MILIFMANQPTPNVSFPEIRPAITFFTSLKSFFLINQGTLREMMPESRSPIHTATAGASAALFTWAVVLPLDVLRTRVQVVFFVGEGPEGGHFGF